MSEQQQVSLTMIRHVAEHLGDLCEQVVLARKRWLRHRHPEGVRGEYPQRSDCGSRASAVLAVEEQPHP